MIDCCSRRGAAYALAQLLAVVAGCAGGKPGEGGGASVGSGGEGAGGSRERGNGNADHGGPRHTQDAAVAWQFRLAGDAIVLLGEFHDNGLQHALRLEVLQRALAAGWRPAIAMEQFDRERQPDIERARRERPGDARHVIALAVPPHSGWNWDYYRPYVALALQYGAPLLAADLSPTHAAAVVRGGYGSVFDAAETAALGLERSIDPPWLAAQEHEIDAGHCHMLPPSLLPAMARAQFARDAVMAEVLRRHAAHGIVLLAGNGHVRRDIGVARWLPPADQQRCFAVGYLEDGTPPWPTAAFDAIVRTPAAARTDPCAGFRKPQ